MNARLTRLAPGLIVSLFLAFPAFAFASDAAIPELRFAGGHFEPSTLTVPANEALKIKVTNADPQPIEFESFELNRERVVAPGASITVFLPALNPGSYAFFNDFNRSAGEGTLVAK